MKNILCAVLTLLTLSCATAGPRESYEEVLAGEAILLDVREEDEVRLGMIEEAHWIPLSQMEADPVATNAKVKNISSGKTIYVYCRSGRRSQVFIDQLSEGLKAKNLGGYEDLLKAGLPRKP